MSGSTLSWRVCQSLAFSAQKNVHFLILEDLGRRSLTAEDTVSPVSGLGGKKWNEFMGHDGTRGSTSFQDLRERRRVG